MSGMQRPCALLLSALLAVWLPAASVWAQTSLPARGSVAVAFSPWDDAEGLLLSAIQGAQRSIHVQAYIFTNRSLARALLERHHAGVKVQVLADAEQARQRNSQIQHLAKNGVSVWLETDYVAAHNKIMLIDAGQAEAAVITGSYNYTWSAQARNAENLLVLRDNPQLMALYLANWQRHQRLAKAHESEQGVRND